MFCLRKITSELLATLKSCSPSCIRLPGKLLIMTFGYFGNRHKHIFVDWICEGSCLGFSLVYVYVYVMFTVAR